MKDAGIKIYFLGMLVNMGSSLGGGAIRMAVKDEFTNKRMLSILDFLLNDVSDRSYVGERRINSL